MGQQLDRDTRQVIAALHEARAASGLSQAAFARSLGTSPPRLSTYLSGQTRPSAQFLVKATRLGNALGAARRRGLMSAPATASAMREYVRAGEPEWIWRMLLQGRDHLGLMIAEHAQDLIDSWEAQPASTGAGEWDALLAAVAAHELERAGLVSPGWALTAPLAEPWLPEHPFLTPDRVRAQTPPWLRARNIYIPARDLATA